MLIKKFLKIERTYVIFGDLESLVDESHNSSLLEYPQYTRPLIFKDMKVPDILVSGNHKEINSWRKQKSIERTLERRSDLILNENYKKSPQSKSIKYDFNDIKNDFFYDP